MHLDSIWAGLSKKASSEYQQYLRLSNHHVNEKYGHLEICPRILWKTMVESWVDNAVHLGNRHVICSVQGYTDCLGSRRRPLRHTVYTPDSYHLSDRKSIETEVRSIWPQKILIIIL